MGIKKILLLMSIIFIAGCASQAIIESNEEYNETKKIEETTKPIFLEYNVDGFTPNYLELKPNTNYELIIENNYDNSKFEILDKNFATDIIIKGETVQLQLETKNETIKIVNLKSKNNQNLKINIKR